MRFSDGARAPAATLPCTLRDHPDWHRGRARYWLWSIPVDCPAVLQRLQAARSCLGEWLHAPGARQAHITLFVCGFATPQPVHNDDIAPAVLDAQCRALAALRQPAFELHIGDLDSFTSAAFLTVQEHGHLDRLRDTLAGLAPEVRQAPYAPHLTVGLYRRAVARATWQQHTRALRDCPPLTLPVRELQLLSYAASEPQGALRIEARVALA